MPRGAPATIRRVKDYILEIAYDTADEMAEELVMARLFTAESTGSSSTEAAGRTTVSAYFDSAAERDSALADLRDLERVDVRSVERDRIDWLERYEQSLEAMWIGSRFVVAPDAALIPTDTDRLTLVVPQEQAFGTGSHETTSLCIELLETLAVGGECGLDIGSGSGILALAMLRLGASRAIAFDNDVDAFGALRDNRMRNGIAEPQMPIFIGSVEALRGGSFDLATMNILPDVIIALLPQVVARLRPGGTLLLSGILTTRSDEVVRAAALHTLRLFDAREREEWWAGVFELKR